MNPFSKINDNMMATLRGENTGKQNIDKLMVRIRGFAHCNCPPDDDGRVRYHSNCGRHLSPLLDELEREIDQIV